MIKPKKFISIFLIIGIIIMSAFISSCNDGSGELPSSSGSSTVSSVSPTAGDINDDSQASIIPSEEPLVAAPEVITQDYVYSRMLNTQDYFNSVSGSYTYTKEGKKITNATYDIDYNSSSEIVAHLTTKTTGTQVPMDFEYFILSPAGSIADGYEISHGQNNYREVTYANDRKPSNRRTLQNFAQTKAERTGVVEGSPSYTYRNNIFASLSASLMPQEMTFGYLTDYDHWTIDGEEQLLGTDCIKLSGFLTGSYSDKLGITDFEMWVQKETGILIKYFGYDEDGQLVDSLITNDFVLNGDVDLDYDVQQEIAGLELYDLNAELEAIRNQNTQE